MYQCNTYVGVCMYVYYIMYIIRVYVYIFTNFFPIFNKKKK